MEQMGATAVTRGCGMRGMVASPPTHQPQKSCYVLVMNCLQFLQAFSDVWGVDTWLTDNLCLVP